MHSTLRIITCITDASLSQPVSVSDSWSESTADVKKEQLVALSSYFIRGGGGGCMGLSGVTLAMMALQAKLSPDKEFRIVLAIFPVTLRANMALTCLLIWSVIGSLARNSEVAHITHLGGLLFGVGYYEVWLRRNQVKLYWHKGNALLKTMGRSTNHD
jgi:Rhomboid family